MTVSEISSSSSIEEQFKEAENFFKDQNLEKCSKIIDQILAKHPNHAPTLHVKAMTLLVEKKNGEALKTCDKIERLVHGKPYANQRFLIPKGYLHVIRAFTLMLDGKREEAEKSINHAIRINKIAPFVQVRGMFHLQGNNRVDAKKDLQYVVENPYSGKMFGYQSEEEQKNVQMLLKLC